MIAACVAMGKADPGAKKWLQANDLPDLKIKDRPGRVCCVSLTSNESIRVQRPKVAKFLPHGTYWKNRHGGGEAVAALPNGGVLLFKTVDQGARSFQADAWDMVWFDEDPEDEGVLNEARMRLIDRRGWCLITMTPLRGLTWVHKRFVENEEEGSRCCWIHGEHNPYIPNDELNALLNSYGPHERAARARGEFVALEGRVYPEWQRGLHVVDSFTPPADWERVAGLDFGTRNPTAFIMGAVDPKDDVLHIFAEHYQAEWTISQHASKIHHMTNHGSPAPLWIVADPADRSARLTLAREHGIRTIAPKSGKNIRERINAVAERLRPDAEGKPHLVVHSNCQNTIREFDSYIWQQTAGMPDKPKKVNDHAMDALGMMCRQLSIGPFGVG